MAVFRSLEPLPEIPDDLTIPQFMLREIGGRPRRPSNVPFFIEDATGRSVSYEEVHHRTFSIANALSLKWNIGRGDVVCVFSPNHIDYAPAIWAVHVLGAIVTPANPTYTADELKHQLETTNAKLIIAHPACYATAASVANTVQLSGTSSIVLFDALPIQSTNGSVATIEQLVSAGERRPEDYKVVRFKPGEARSTIAFLCFSSGTTGMEAKGTTLTLAEYWNKLIIHSTTCAVAISHYSVIANVLQMAAHYNVNDPNDPHRPLSPGDIALAVLPFFHIYGLVVTMHFLLFSSLSLVVVPKFSLQEFLRSIVRHHVTHLYVVPPQIVLLCKHPEVKKYDLSRVKFCFSGAAPLGGELMRQIAHILPNAVIGQGYGLTETCTSVALSPTGHKMSRLGSAGRLIPGLIAKVVKEDGSLAKEGEMGELVVTGPSMSLGYFRNPKATAETFIDGWVKTGDEVIIKDNEVYVVDRLKEIMKVRGFQVAPAELEAHLLLHPDVADACVVPIADEYSGELPLAYIVPAQPASERVSKDPSEADKLARILVKHVADAKVPYKRLAGGVHFIDAIPKNPSGKILRRVLREQAKSLPKTTRLSSKL